ncbi:MAG: Fe-S-binding domain-containing protein, partial [Chloroflexi bacterium]|nr:Fe-S-binding domain-containing protein [Chloroflexota bacterium]
MGLLTFLTFFPVIGIIVLLVLRKDSDEKLFKQIAVGTSIVTFVISLVVLANFDSSVSGLQMYKPLDWIPTWGIHYALGIDGISILMILLTTFISMLAIASSWDPITEQVRNYYIFMLLLETGMLGVFLAQDMFLFYVFWEFTLVPMYFLVGIWGGKQRVYAAIKFFLYTMAGSLLMLLAILWIGIQVNTFLLPEMIAQRSEFAKWEHILFI